jgi:hypothetical protein
MGHRRMGQTSAGFLPSGGKLVTGCWSLGSWHWLSASSHHLKPAGASRRDLRSPSKDIPGEANFGWLAGKT